MSSISVLSFVSFVLHGTGAVYKSVSNLPEVKVTFDGEWPDGFPQNTSRETSKFSVSIHNSQKNRFFAATFPQLQQIEETFSNIDSTLGRIRNVSVLLSASSITVLHWRYIKTASSSPILGIVAGALALIALWAQRRKNHLSIERQKVNVLSTQIQSFATTCQDFIHKPEADHKSLCENWIRTTVIPPLTKVLIAGNFSDNSADKMPKEFSEYREFMKDFLDIGDKNSLKAFSVVVGKIGAKLKQGMPQTEDYLKCKEAAKDFQEALYGPPFVEFFALVILNAEDPQQNRTPSLDQWLESNLSLITDEKVKKMIENSLRAYRNLEPIEVVIKFFDR